MSHVEPQAVLLPRESRIAAFYASPELADAYSIDLPLGTARDPELLARFIFAHPPRWVAALMDVRDSVASILGLKTGRSLRSANGQPDRIGIFRVYETHPSEIILGENDQHLDFRVSVFYRESQGPQCEASLVLSTVVDCHNLLGRTYLALIAPFHRLVVRSFLREGARLGWPPEPSLPSHAAPGIGVQPIHRFMSDVRLHKHKEERIVQESIRPPVR